MAAISLTKVLPLTEKGRLPTPLFLIGGGRMSPMGEVVAEAADDVVLVAPTARVEDAAGGAVARQMLLDSTGLVTAPITSDGEAIVPVITAEAVIIEEPAAEADETALARDAAEDATEAAEEATLAKDEATLAAEETAEAAATDEADAEALNAETALADAAADEAATDAAADETIISPVVEPPLSLTMNLVQSSWAPLLAMALRTG